jgi:hypothetical protein
MPLILIDPHAREDHTIRGMARDQWRHVVLARQSVTEIRAPIDA